eukprot:scaffold215667_cov34-Tisochrysis_lutea.AAC.3
MDHAVRVQMRDRCKESLHKNSDGKWRRCGRAVPPVSKCTILVVGHLFDGHHRWVTQPHQQDRLFVAGSSGVGVDCILLEDDRATINLAIPQRVPTG